MHLILKILIEWEELQHQRHQQTLWRWWCCRFVGWSGCDKAMKQQRTEFITHYSCHHRCSFIIIGSSIQTKHIIIGSSPRGDDEWTTLEKPVKGKIRQIKVELSEKPSFHSFTNTHSISYTLTHSSLLLIINLFNILLNGIYFAEAIHVILNLNEHGFVLAARRMMMCVVLGKWILELSSNSR